MSDLFVRNREDGLSTRDDTSAADGEEKAQLLEEALQVSKRQVVTGIVRVSTTTETHQEVAEVGLDRSVVDVTRVPIGRVVEVAPQLRTENGTTIVPAMEERFVVVKQLFLKEELHIRKLVERELTRAPVALRRQVASIERIDASGRAVLDHLDTQQTRDRAIGAPIVES